jgi:hypothetical protein
MTRRIAHAAPLVALVVALAVAAPVALAGKGGGGKGGNTGGTGTGTISLVLLNSTDGLAHFGQQVTFNVSTTSTTMPWVTLQCYQNGSLVYKMSNGIFATSLNQNFTLGPTPSWPGGAADCTAWLQNWDSYAKRGAIQNITSTGFHIYA